MDPRSAAVVTAPRPALESLVIAAADDPEKILEPVEQDEKTLQVVRNICKMNSARHEMEQVGMGGFQTKRPPRSFGGHDDDEPPAKRGPGFNSMFGNRGYGGGGGFRGRGGFRSGGGFGGGFGGGRG